MDFHSRTITSRKTANSLCIGPQIRSAGTARRVEAPTQDLQDATNPVCNHHQADGPDTARLAPHAYKRFHHCIPYHHRLMLGITTSIGIAVPLDTQCVRAESSSVYLPSSVQHFQWKECKALACAPSQEELCTERQECKPLRIYACALPWALIQDLAMSCCARPEAQ